MEHSKIMSNMQHTHHCLNFVETHNHLAVPCIERPRFGTFPAMFINSPFYPPPLIIC